MALFEVDPESRLRRYRWAYISVPKKNGKTELMAALALWFLIDSGEPSPLVVCAAGSDDQADLIFGAAKTMAEESPTLKAICTPYEDEITVPSIPGAKLQRVASTSRKHGSNLDGKNIFVVICDELHVWEGNRGEVVWGTLTRGTGARRAPMVIQITTAGFDRESICYRQYAHARKVSADPSVDPAFFPFIVEAPDGADHTDPKVWAEFNPSFGTVLHEGFYRDQLTKQPENEFRRFYLNQWTRSAESWLPAGAWDRCLSEEHEISDGSRVVVAVDAALYHDSTAVVVAHEADDGRVVVRAKVFVKGVNGVIDQADVKAHILGLADRYRVEEVAYDPRLFEVQAQELADVGLPMVPFKQSPERMVPACGHAFEQIAAGVVAHDGDPVLSDHVLSAAQRVQENGWMLSKGRSRRQIDACVAMVMALWTLAASSQAEPEAPPLVMMIGSLIG